MGLREQSIVGFFPKFVFQLSVEQVLVGLRKQFINNFVFPTWACAAGFKKNNKYISFLNCVLNLLLQYSSALMIFKNSSLMI